MKIANTPQLLNPQRMEGKNVYYTKGFQKELDTECTDG